MKKNVLLILFFSVLSCSNFFEDKTILGDNYYFLGEYEIKDISYPYGNMIYHSFIGKNYYTNICVYGDIIDYSVFKEYIFVRQQYNLNLIKKRIKDNILATSKYDEIDSVNLIYKKVKASEFELSLNRIDTSIINKYLNNLIEKNNYFKERLRNKTNYYIINKTSKNQTGPLTKDEFSKIIKIKKLNFDYNTFTTN